MPGLRWCELLVPGQHTFLLAAASGWTAGRHDRLAGSIGWQAPVVDNDDSAAKHHRCLRMPAGCTMHILRSSIAVFGAPNCGSGSRDVA